MGQNSNGATKTSFPAGVSTYETPQSFSSKESRLIRSEVKLWALSYVVNTVDVFHYFVHTWFTCAEVVKNITLNNDINI